MILQNDMYASKGRNAGNIRAPISMLALILITFPLFRIVHPETNLLVMKFVPEPGPILNPMMGWAPWATIRASTQPHTLVYADLTWREFEPQQGIYDFQTFEEKNQLARWRQEGKRVVFRFVADIPGEELHMDIPDWLYAAMNENGDYYDNEYGMGFSPDYSDPVLLTITSWRLLPWAADMAWMIFSHLLSWVVWVIGENGMSILTSGLSQKKVSGIYMWHNIVKLFQILIY